MLALGHGFGRRALLSRMAKEASEGWRESYRSATQLILGQLDSPSPLLTGAACSAIGELGRSGPLPLSDEEAMETGDSDNHKKAAAAIESKLDLGCDSIEKNLLENQLEKPLEFWLQIPYTDKKYK